jgi:hypothetical protein
LKTCFQTATLESPELDDGLGPQEAGSELFVDMGADQLVGDVDEAGGVLTVVLDQLLAKLKDVQGGAPSAFVR